MASSAMACLSPRFFPLAPPMACASCEPDVTAPDAREALRTEPSRTLDEEDEGAPPASDVEPAAETPRRRREVCRLGVPPTGSALEEGSGMSM